MNITQTSFKDKVLDLSINGVYVYDLIQGTNLYINQQYTSLTGYSLDDINDMDHAEFFSLFHPEDQEEVANHMSLVPTLLPDEISIIEYRFKRKDGSWMWCRSHDSIFERDHEEKPTQFMGAFIDFSSQKVAEAKLASNNRKLQSKNQELEQMSYIISHDLQEPLRTITNFSGLISRKYEGKLDEKGNQYLSIISQASARMGKMVRGILALHSKSTSSPKTEIDCEALLSSVITELSAVIEEKNVVIEIGELPRVFSWENDLRLLFQNLISNAIKFSKSEGIPEISISAIQKDRAWAFSVQDNGIGIDPRYHREIFRIFERLHSKDSYEGTGIGLAHCKKIVDKLGGEIWVESKPEQGSTFTFTVSIG